MEVIQRILLVEDDKELALAIRETLELGQFDCHHVLDGQLAINYLERNPVDLILCDVNLPKINGFQFINYVQRKLIDIPVILMTAYGAIADAIRAIQLGAKDYLVKPFSPDDINQTLLMSILYNGEIRSMPPKLLSDDKRHIVIRPLVYCQESDIIEYASLKAYPILPCNLCGSQEKLARQRVKGLLEKLAQENPKIPSNILHAVGAVKPSQLMDQKLWNFRDLESEQQFSIGEDQYC